MSSYNYNATGGRWDLSDLFRSHDDPAIEETLAACRARAERFAERYRGTIRVPGGPPPEHLLAAILDMEVLQGDLERAGAFASLLYESDTARPEHRDLRECIELRLTLSRHGVLLHLIGPLLAPRLLLKQEVEQCGIGRAGVGVTLKGHLSPHHP